MPHNPYASPRTVVSPTRFACLGLAAFGIATTIALADAVVLYSFYNGLDTQNWLGLTVFLAHETATLPGLPLFVMLDYFSIIPNGEDDDQPFVGELLNYVHRRNLVRRERRGGSRTHFTEVGQCLTTTP